MARLPSPALTFYLDHAVDCDALWQLDTAPDGVHEEEWKKFLAVRAKANDQVADLLLDCRARAVAAFSPSFEGGRMQTKTAHESWYASGVLRTRAPNVLQSFWVGCGLGCGLSAAPGEVFLYPYVDSNRGGDRPAFRKHLESLGLSFAPLPANEFLGDECIVLGLVPVTPQTDLDEAIVASVRPFEELAKLL